jgi:iron complex outermembrane receptor protein
MANLDDLLWSQQEAVQSEKSHGDQKMRTPNQLRRGLVVAASLTAFGISLSAQAQTDVFIEEVIVTATKRAGGISVQDAPVAITAFNEEQIDGYFIRDVRAIGSLAPNVALEDLGTTPGVANFSIRGLGINSSIPSIDPTVGVFVDGMYMGVNAGIVTDIFDLEGIEVLRGPQGLLFGRNVTGGAVLLRTTRPTDELSINARVASETGSNNYASAVVSGPFSDTVRGKIAVYANDDGGWHTNLANGNASFGGSETKLVRGAIDFDIGDNGYMIFRAEVGDTDGDGPAAQNGGLFPDDGFQFAIDEEGFNEQDWSSASVELTWDVGGGDGQIYNLLAWRDYSSLGLSDIDATSSFLFHAGLSLNQDQISNELRYSGSIGDMSYLTAGLYYFGQNMSYREQRVIPPSGLDITGGGDIDQSTIAVFGQLDIDVVESLTLNLGIRYTQEEKEGHVATLFLDLCEINAGCLAYDFNDKQTWSSITPKIGLQYATNEDGQLYAFWTKGFRSGGYNLRHTLLTIPNQAFDQEEQNTVEIGWKQDFADGRFRMNLATFLNRISDLQREINESDPLVGVQQLIRNTADADIAGFEGEFYWQMSDTFFFRANLGYVDGSYTEVRFDLNGDGVIDDKDLNLALPRLSPWSYGAELMYSREFGWGSLSARIDGYHRDRAAYTDNNLGWLRASDMLGAAITTGFMDDRLRVSVFGRNLKDESTIGGDTQLPFFPGATFSPLNKGKTYGVEVQWRQ